MHNCSVEDICVKKEDSQGKEILEVYGRKSPDYAVYRTKERVLVQFADDKNHGAEQRRAMAPLNPLRGEINGLLDSWRESDRLTANKRALRYARRGGDALIVAFEEDVASAQTLLAGIKSDILDERTAWARFEYLACAILMAGGTMLLSWIAVSDIDLDKDGSIIWRAAAAGTVGAFFSIAIAIKGRTTRPDLQRTANNLDAALRIFIGFIAAAVLAALVLTKSVVLEFGEAKLGHLGAPAHEAIDKSPTISAGSATGEVNRTGGSGANAKAGETEAGAKAGGAGLKDKTGGPGAEDKSGKAAVIPLDEGGHPWLYILLVGFIAGFSERLVPDLLTKASTTAPSRSQAPAVGPKRPANAKDSDLKDPGVPGGGVAPTAVKEADPVPAEADTDHCACAFPLTQGEVTHDKDLPAASGGVAPASRVQENP